LFFNPSFPVGRNTEGIRRVLRTGRDLGDIIERSCLNVVRPDQKHGMVPILVKGVRKEGIGKVSGDRKHRYKTRNESDYENRFLHRMRLMARH
jgi:hypothetical protein